MKTLTLSEVRARCGGEVLSADEARRIIGRTNAMEPWLPNMIQALNLMTWRNTPEDWLRLQAAMMVRAEKRRASK